MSRSNDLKALRVAPGDGNTPSGAAPHAIDAYCLEYDYLYRTLQRFGVGTADVEDVAHQVFLVLHQKWTEYDATRPLRPYLFGIAFRVAATYRRQRRREVPWTSREVQDPAPQPDQLLSNAEAREIVLHALEHVDLTRRAVLIMHDLDETPMRVVAEALHIPLFTAYSRLRKARKEFENAVRRIGGGIR
jgi:RNA polymerase sigma-70 factor, ECF subfamily